MSSGPHMTSRPATRTDRLYHLPDGARMYFARDMNSLIRTQFEQDAQDVISIDATITVHVCITLLPTSHSINDDMKIV